MPDFGFILLHVDSPAKSASFYSGLLGISILEQSPTFCMLSLRDGVMLGLWSRLTVEPESAGAAGTSEIAFTVADAQAVQQTYDDWTKRPLKILQHPTRMDFGTSFVACDPDGHRLRVFAPQ